MRRISRSQIQIAASVLALTQVGANSLDARAQLFSHAQDALTQGISGAPIQDPSDVLEMLSIDPVVRLTRAETQLILARRAKRPEITDTAIDPALSAVVSQKVQSISALLTTPYPNAKTARPTAFDFGQFARRARARATRAVAVPRSHSATPQIRQAIAQASASVGVSQTYMLRTAARESSFDHTAKASSSSATGLYQFLSSTWLLTVRKHGHKHGLTDHASHIRLEGGMPVVDSATARRQILALRYDPRLSSLMAAEFTNDNANVLRKNLGYEPDFGALYAAHFLGANGAVTLYQYAQRSPHIAARNLFPDAARANPAVFYSHGRPRSVHEVKLILAHKANGG